MNVNVRLLPAKIAFFGQNSAATWSIPFLVLIFRQMGLTPSESSIILGSLPLTNGFVRLLLGVVTDKLQKHRETVFMLSILSTVIFSCLLLVPPVPETTVPSELQENLTALCNQSQSVQCIMENQPEGNDRVLGSCFDLSEAVDKFLAPCDDHMREWPTQQTCLFSCNNTLLTFDTTSVKGKPYGTTFWTTFVIVFLAYNMYSANWPLLYGMTYAVLGNKRNSFGKQRAWGTVGSLVTAVVSAFALNKYGSNQSTDINYTPCFIGYGISLCMTGVAQMFLPVPHMPRNPTMAKDVGTLLKQPRIFAMFTVLLIMGFLWGAVETFLFWFLRSLGATSWNLGACLFVACAAEIPSLYFSGRIIAKLGYVRCLYFALCAYCVRYLGTSLIPNPWWELPFISIRSIVFSIGFTAVSVHSSAITPPSMHATLQSMVTATHFGFGRGFGILAFGPIMESVGARWAFRVCSGLALVTCIGYSIAEQVMPPVHLPEDEENVSKVQEVLMVEGESQEDEAKVEEDRYSGSESQT